MTAHDYPDYDRFAALQGEAFQVTTPSGARVGATLTEVEPQAVDPRAAATGAPIRDVPFALLFVAPADALVDQGIHTVEHAALGRHEVFLVPIGPHGDGLGLQAIFS